MERFSFVFLVAGLGFFALAFLVSALLPWMEFKDIKIATLEELTEESPQSFYDLKEQYPDAFDKAFGMFKKDGDIDMSKALADALVVGKKIYVGEGCWHCHSQQVRPVGNDEARFGRISYPEEYNNEMYYPPLWGTRRIGPDLIREADKKSNDWHMAHFWNPPSVSPTSVMPKYPWFFEKDDPKTEDVDESLEPNKKGLAMVAYVQWLGSWINEPKETVYGLDTIERFTSPTVKVK